VTGVGTCPDDGGANMHVKACLAYLADVFDVRGTVTGNGDGNLP